MGKEKILSKSFQREKIGHIKNLRIRTTSAGQHWLLMEQTLQIFKETLAGVACLRTQGSQVRFPVRAHA